VAHSEGSVRFFGKQWVTISSAGRDRQRLRRRAARALLAVLVGGVLAATSGCLMTLYPQLDLRDLMAAGEWDYVLYLLREYGADSSDPVLADLLRGHVLHYAGDFRASNTALGEALAMAVRSPAGGADSADNVLNAGGRSDRYDVTPFEVGMVPFYRTFNLISAGEWNAARYEAQRATVVLADAAEALVAEIEVAEDRQRARQLAESGFLQWFSGLLFESSGADLEAFVAYRQAAGAFLANRDLTGLTPPTALGRDLERVALRTGFRAEVVELRAEAPELFPLPERRPGRGGEIVFVLETGWIATRNEVVVTVPTLEEDRRFSSLDAWARELVVRAQPGWQRDPGSEITGWLSVALPTMMPPTTGEVAQVRLRAAGFEASSQPADDLSRRAEVTLEVGRARMLETGFASALAGGVGGVALGGSRGDVARPAETRCWWSLPDRLSVARLRLPPGGHEVVIDYLDAAGRVVLSETEVVEMTDGGWVFLNRRTF
jgi:hypothetical protein